MITKRKTIHYKSVSITGESNLQTLLDDALGPDGKASKPNQRQQIINEDDEAAIFVNRYKKHNGVSFGQLVILESGKHQPFITIDDDADFYSIDSLSSEKIPDLPNNLSVHDKKNEEQAAKKRREFLDSILYFGVFDNHMIVMQSSALRSRELEAHLSWLLGTCTQSINLGSVLVLKDKPAESVFKKMESNPVKSISVGAPLTAKVETNPSHYIEQSINDNVEQEQGVHASKVRFNPTGMAADIIKAALSSEIFDSFKLEESLDESNIHVALEITYRRKTTKTGQKIIDSIATSLRHNPESDVTINLHGGGKIKGNELKLSGTISVKYLKSGLVDESVLFHEMQVWLSSKISDSEIDSTSESFE